MLRKILGSLLVIILIVSASAAAWAVIKGIEEHKQALVKIGESVVVPEGAEVESAVSVGGSVTVYGRVIEDVVSVGGSVYLKDPATVGGDVVAVGGKIMREPGAIVRGDIIEVAVAGIAPTVSFFTKGGILKGLALFKLFSFIGFLALTIILLAVFTPQLGRVSAALEKDLLQNFLWGLLIAVLFIPIILVLMVSLVGIVLVPLWGMLVAAAGLFGYIAVGHLLGKKTLHAFKTSGWSMMVETLIGVVLLSLIGLIPVGGFLIKMIASLCGLGGVWLTRFGVKQ